MADHIDHHPSIIYSNPTYTVMIIDIPQSIAVAQHLSSPPEASLPSPLPRLYSTPPISKPYLSTEPRTGAAFLKLTRNLSAAEVKLQEVYVEIIEPALREVRAVMGKREREWCLPRLVAPSKMGGGDVAEGGKGRKRKRKWMFEREGKGKDGSAEKAGSQDEAVVEEDFRRTSVKYHHNSSDDPQSFTFDVPESTAVPSNQPTVPDSYTIPPRSAFLLTSVSDTDSFQRLTTAISPDEPLRFPFMLLDPPWPNRSVIRSSSYAIPAPRNLPELRELLLNMKLEQYLADGGHVAVWVTNKIACRDVVIGTGGLFEQMGLEVVEEWVWVKVTRFGEPVTELKGLWRKPYEVCIVGRKRRTRDANNPIGELKAGVEIVRRVLFGVPDLHSRKPCLKRLAERLLVKEEERQGKVWGLEMFARCCVAECVAWGDEAVLFNCKDQWVDVLTEEKVGELTV